MATVKKSAKSAVKKAAVKKVAEKTAVKKTAVKKVVEKKAAEKKAVEKKTAVKKVEVKKVEAEPQQRRLNGKILKPGKKMHKAKGVAPLRMKKMVVKQPKEPISSFEYENKQKDFAFMIAESRKQETRAAMAPKPLQLPSGQKLSRRPTTRKQGQETLCFAPNDLAQFRKTLIALRDRTVGKTQGLKNTAFEQTIDRAGEDEDGSESFMRLQALGQANDQITVLNKIDEALRRIDDGTYGICEICGKLIRKQRLQHLPFAHTCLECQSVLEHRRG